LTFQEYFAAREIAATNQIDLLVPHITEKRWREVFLLTVGMMRNADELLLAMKSFVDLRLSQNDRLQQSLKWVIRISPLAQSKYEPAVVRAFNFASDLNGDGSLNLSNGLDLALALDLDLASDIEHYIDRMNALMDYVADGPLYEAISLKINFEHLPICDYAPDIKCRLRKLIDRLPDTFYQNREAFEQWWQTNGLEWTEDCRQIMADHSDIVHDWQLTDAQKALLRQYHDANLLLVQCLNSDCYVSRSVRQEIEDTLLLPMAEIEKRREKKEEGREN
jgi:predicted NACHT family NTPase